MKKVWNVNVDGVNYCVEYTTGVFSRKLAVNGIETKLKSQNAFVMLVDMPIMLGAKPAQFVVIGNKVDIAIDGMYLDQQTPYVPLNAVPTYAYIFVGLAMVVGFLFNSWMGLVISILFGTKIITTSIRIRTDGKSNTGMCVVWMIASMLTTIVVGILFSLLLYI